MTRRPVADVREAVARWLDGNPEKDRFMLWVAKHGVNVLLNDGTYDPYDYGTEAQVGRVLDEIAAHGGLIKLRRGGAGPDGRAYRNRQPTFYSRAAWDAAVAEAGRDARQAEATREQWGRIWDALAAREIVPVTERGKSVRLSMSAWTGFLGLDED